MVKSVIDRRRKPRLIIRKDATTIKSLWDREGFSWILETEIPHSTFVIMEDGETYCRGIVFSLEDVKE